MSKENAPPKWNNHGRPRIVSSRIMGKVIIQKARKNPGLSVGKKELLNLIESPEIKKSSVSPAAMHYYLDELEVKASCDENLSIRKK